MLRLSSFVLHPGGSPSPAFTAFMKKNFQLAALFRLPENYGTPESLAGLQTRASVQNQIQARFAFLVPVGLLLIALCAGRDPAVCARGMYMLRLSSFVLHPGGSPSHSFFLCLRWYCSAYSNSTAGVIPVAASKRTISFPTSSMVRVLGTSTFLLSSEYYDEKGRHIQTIEDNIKLGRDVTTLQYHWDGRLMSSHTKHTTANSGYTNFGILTKNLFDKIGRVTSIQKKFGSNAFESVASYDFDDMGRLKTKHLDPGYTGIAGKNELESLTYSYNIHNNITGINKDYALKTSGKYDKWGNFFGLYLGYDNKDNVFVNKQLDEHVTGQLWNT